MDSNTVFLFQITAPQIQIQILFFRLLLLRFIYGFLDYCFLDSNTTDVLDHVMVSDFFQIILRFARSKYRFLDFYCSLDSNTVFVFQITNYLRLNYGFFLRLRLYCYIQIERTQLQQILLRLKYGFLADTSSQIELTNYLADSIYSPIQIERKQLMFSFQ